MPKWLKVVLAAGLGSMALCCLGVSVFAGWAKEKAGEVQVQAADAQRAGTFFGQGRDSEECLREALVRANACGPMDVVCQMGSQGFIRGCLTTATRLPQTCEGVPPLREIIRSATWRVERCQQLDPAHLDRCKGMIAPVQDFCLR